MNFFLVMIQKSCQILGGPELSFPTITITKQNRNFRNCIKKGRILAPDHVFLIYLILFTYSTCTCTYAHAYSLGSRWRICGIWSKILQGRKQAWRQGQVKVGVVIHTRCGEGARKHIYCQRNTGNVKRSWLQNRVYSVISFCRPGSIWSKVSTGVIPGHWERMFPFVCVF